MLDLCGGGIDAADLGVQRELGALLRCLGCTKLCRHGLELNLGILLPEFGIGSAREESLNVFKPLCIEFDLRVKSSNVGLACS